MTKEGYDEYVISVYGKKNGTANSYIMAIRIIDKMFEYDDVFGLHGKSVATIEDMDLLLRISEFIHTQQTLFVKGEDSIFRSIDTNQKSYPGKGFCSAAMKQLLNYCKHNSVVKQAEQEVSHITSGTKISNVLVDCFKIDKVGKDADVQTKVRLGQNYFRRMVLANYDGKCCVTGLNVPQTLRASHIVAWAEDKRHRMDPENGLCLSATYDAAFDKHLISFDEDYRMIVSREIKDYYTNEVTKEYFADFEGKQILLPKKYMPSQKLLARHRELLVV